MATSVEQHARFGGVVPEVASRAHLEAMVPTIERACRDGRRRAARPRRDRRDRRARAWPGRCWSAWRRPRRYAIALGNPIYGVNHLAAHVAVDTLEHGPLPEPAIALLVSGGHSSLLLVPTSRPTFSPLGATIDDAAGEAFDKVARLLGPAVPGRAADRPRPRARATGSPSPSRAGSRRPRPSRHRFDFSFSGLKTAVARWVEARQRAGEPVPVADVAASFQEAVGRRAHRARRCDACTEHGVEHLLIGGGVAANSRLRALAQERCDAAGIALRVPRPGLCTDNGAMVAALGAQLVAKGREPSDLGLPADSSMPVTLTQA